MLPYRHVHDARAEGPLLDRIPTRTLLNFLSFDTVLPKLLSIALEFTDDAGSDSTDIPPPLDYLSHIRHLHLQAWATGLDHLWKWIRAPSKVSTYILTQEFMKQCEQGALFPIFDPRTIRFRQFQFQANKKFNQKCYEILFFREASWALASVILDQLQSLTIPFSIVGRYLESISMSRLVNLERVHFILDDVRKDAPRDEDEEFKPMVRFVEEHT
ncbi:hypothetical protein BGX24_005369 [Mortierella sp. AD032]|nr:hypothetical protein BGX24_005369 [Mortierella sp. AD032]